MNVDCKDLDRILASQDAAQMAALEAHAAACDACRQQLALDREISVAARGMQRIWESPDLWPRIAQQLQAEPPPAGAGWLVSLFAGWQFNWQVAMATAALALLAVASTWLVIGHQPPSLPDPVAIKADQQLLNEAALAEVQKAETAYISSIDRLSALAAPKLQNADSALLANYREKLLVLDAAITECRMQLDQNRFNAHLRRELLSIYQMKQATLTDVLQEAAQ